MSGSHHELHIDVPVKLDEVRRDGVGRVELDDFTPFPLPPHGRICVKVINLLATRYKRFLSCKYRCHCPSKRTDIGRRSARLAQTNIKELVVIIIPLVENDPAGG
jgi:hypothetical protein